MGQVNTDRAFKSTRPLFKALGISLIINVLPDLHGVWGAAGSVRACRSSRQRRPFRLGRDDFANEGFLSGLDLFGFATRSVCVMPITLGEPRKLSMSSENHFVRYLSLAMEAHPSGFYSPIAIARGGYHRPSTLPELSHA